MTLVGAFTWSDPSAASELAGQLAQRAACHPALTHRQVVQTSHLVGFAIERSGSASRVDAWLGEDGSSCLFAGRLVGAHTAPRDTFRAALERASLQAIDVDGCWLALAQRPDGASLLIHTDPLGISWLFLARWRDGYLFSGDFGALMRTLPETPGPDEESALVMLALGYSPDARTCAKGVELVPPGALLEISRRGEQILSTLGRPFGDRYAGWSDERKRDWLGDVMSAGLRAWCHDAARPLVLSLSGGYDSRFALAHLVRDGNPPRCVTFGHPRSPDVRSARAIARRAGLETNLYYNHDSTSWSAWRQSVERLGTTGGFQWSGWTDEWLAFVRRYGASAILGYLGDALSGKHLVDLPAHRGDWLENWIAWSLDGGWSGSPLLLPSAQKMMDEAVHERLRSIVGGLSVAYPHQLALHMDLAGRQRRHVAAQPNLMARVVDPILFFCTRAQVDFWANLSPDDLRHQRLYLAYARKHFPRLFPAEQRPSIVTRAMGVARNYAIRRVPRLRSWLAPLEIDTARHAVENREHFLALIDESMPLIGQWFRVPALRSALESVPASRAMTPTQALCLANLLVVLRTCHSGVTRTATQAGA